MGGKVCGEDNDIPKETAPRSRPRPRPGKQQGRREQAASDLTTSDATQAAVSPGLSAEGLAVLL